MASSSTGQHSTRYWPVAALCGWLLLDVDHPCSCAGLQCTAQEEAAGWFQAHLRTTVCVSSLLWLAVLLCVAQQVSQIKSTVHELLALFKDNRLYMGGDCGDTAMVVLTPRSDIKGVTEVRQLHHT